VASPAEHLARAATNEILADRLTREGELNWAVTLYFYAVVHYSGALLSRVGVDTEGLDHLTTQSKLDKHHPAVRGRYMQLEGMSRRARYIPAHEADARTVERAARLCAEVKDYQKRAAAGLVPGR
jgi:hypothetical protein